MIRRGEFGSRLRDAGLRVDQYPARGLVDDAQLRAAVALDPDEIERGIVLDGGDARAGKQRAVVGVDQKILLAGRVGRAVDGNPAVPQRSGGAAPCTSGAGMLAAIVVMLPPFARS